MADNSQQGGAVRSSHKHKKPIHCFDLPDSAFIPHQNHLLQNLLNRNFPDISTLSEQQQIALARLVPMLLCGEQSAMFVFHREAARLANKGEEECYKALMQIEADEFVHEQVLQKLQSLLPQPDDVDRIRKRSRLFYARIDRQSTSLASHFWQISQLDASVCLILSALNKAIHQHPISEIFSAIMRDEARHVAIARQHAQFLASDQIQCTAPSIHNQLVELLKTETASLHALDIDANALFQRITKLSITKPFITQLSTTKTYDREISP
ncbi:hypothetical protein EOPP23_17565 [Endozoicomonas sp. OPT23]|uniref:hypothetical protein n=1 Tax=Endozoicomonas sp. OPT23 TaxID=2072845 RepID=UPI00129B49DE|nr:hypothetical protein [Endozoicomonas sp. OPT23]MRI34792.1 hypothetical protein [Endozoicomonas sp. OPT23]